MYKRQNALPDADMRVLIAQITSTGNLDGTINFQVFPLGVGANQETVSIDFNVLEHLQLRVLLDQTTHVVVLKLLQSTTIQLLITTMVHVLQQLKDVLILLLVTTILLQTLTTDLVFS